MTGIFMKHSMSCLADQAIDIEIDRHRKEVLLTMSVFDSFLISEVVTRVLPQDHGVVAFRDDRQKDDATWLTKPSEYALSIDLDGWEYRAEVVRLINGTDIAVTLEPRRGAA